MQNNIKIIAVSGSLRDGSSNTLLLQTIGKMMPATVSFFLYKGIWDLPHFDDAATTPVAVTVWRNHLQDADAVLVCSPEYAFGVPGSLKNALDWTVGSGSLINKPLALITASTGGEKAHASMLEIFTALSPIIPGGCALLISFIRSKLNAAGEITDPATAAAVQQLVDALVSFTRQKKVTA